MIEFKDIDLKDFEIYQSFFKDNSELSCEITFVNQLLWQKAYGNKMAVKDGILFIKNESANTVSFRLPKGGSLERGVELLKKYCGKMPNFWSEEGELFDRFCEKYKNEFEIYESREDFEYIYLSEKLANLSGKKYHSKRNHISAFSKKYNWSYKPITIENLDQVINCAEEWYKNRNELNDRFLECEKNGIAVILSNMEKLKAKGGAVYVDGKIVAFTIGSAVNENVFDIHIEKALEEYQGAYAVINREFARELIQYKYINREDDMGIEGLRTAKLSYKPEIILKKYFCKAKV